MRVIPIMGKTLALPGTLADSARTDYKDVKSAHITYICGGVQRGISRDTRGPRYHLSNRNTTELLLISQWGSRKGENARFDRC